MAALPGQRGDGELVRRGGWGGSSHCGPPVVLKTAAIVVCPARYRPEEGTMKISVHRQAGRAGSSPVEKAGGAIRQNRSPAGWQARVRSARRSVAGAAPAPRRSQHPLLQSPTRGIGIEQRSLYRDSFRCRKTGKTGGQSPHQVAGHQAYAAQGHFRGGDGASRRKPRSRATPNRKPAPNAAFTASTIIRSASP